MMMMSLDQIAKERGFQKADGYCEKHGAFKAWTAPGIRIEDRCPQCQKEREAAAAAKYREDRIRIEFESILQSYGVPEIFLNASFDSFQTRTQTQADMKRLVRGLVDGGYRSITLIGTPGVGKTHLMCAAIREMAKREKDCIYVTEAEILRELKATYNKSSRDSESAIIDRYTRPALLCIDELRGTEWSQWDGVVLADIIDRRWQRVHKRTILAGNIGVDQLKAHFEDRTISRLYAAGEIYACVDEDYRRR